MAATSPHATFSASSLPRCLTGLGAADHPQPAADPGCLTPPSFAERLGLWLGWTDAIALAAALGSDVAAPSLAALPDSPQRSNAAAVAAAALEACQRVRSDLVKLAAADVAYTAGVAGEQALDFSPYRRDYLAHQRAMESAIAPLRVQVRAALSSQTPAGARLAALDAVMDEALRPRERQLLATVPVWLEAHFERLQQAQAGVESSIELDADAADRQALHHRYQRDMQRVLLAELELRLEPTLGLLEALRHETRVAP